MSVAAVPDPVTGLVIDPLTGWLNGVLAGLADGVGDCASPRDVDDVSDAMRIDRIAQLEKIKAAAAALQMAESVRFAQSQAKAQLAADVHPDKIGRGIADQLGLACQISGFEATRRLGMARALWFELPETYRLLVGGKISEYVASLVVTETRHLDATARRGVDAKITDAGITRMGPRSAAAAARRHAYEADPYAYLERGRTERKHRRVSLRPAPDTMSLLSGYLPAEQGIACLKSLRDHTDTVKAAGDPRCRDQIMADTLVERITGQTKATDVNAELQIVMPLDTLLDVHDHTPVELAGYGPLPADLARDITASSKGRLWWRRLYAAPVGGPVVGGDPHRRRFDGHLRKLIMWRDRRCRDPFCDAPIRHIDHIQRYSDSGLTVYPNGRGECERGNYAREMPGWKVEAVCSGLDGRPHTIKITTPTGHSYLSRA
jgi:hypothetical protein